MLGIRLISIFEFFKGLCALLVSVGLFDIVEKKKINFVHDFLSHVHPHALKKIARFTVAKIELLNDHEAKLILAFGIMYAGLRIAEGYGLWTAKHWGRQIGIWSALLYLPFEFYEIFHDFSGVKVIITLINIGVVMYLWKTHF